MRRLFAILLLSASPSLAAAQDRSVPVLVARDSAGDLVFWKDPKHASSLSWWVAGAGHVYVGQEGMGYLLATTDIVLGTAGFAGLWVSMHCDVYTCNGSEKKLAIGGILGSLVLSAWSAGDAERLAREHNARYHLGVISLPQNRFGLSLSVR